MYPYLPPPRWIARIAKTRQREELVRALPRERLCGCVGEITAHGGYDAKAKSWRRNHCLGISLVSVPTAREALSDSVWPETSISRGLYLLERLGYCSDWLEVGIAGGLRRTKF